MSFGMEDLASHLAMAAAGVRGVAIPEPLFSYRKRAGSMSRGFEPHAVAYLYRRIRQANPGFFRRFGPELVGLYAENGHGALAPPACEPSEAHRALFDRDIPDRVEIDFELERRAARDGLARALRARCAGGGAEWDYTTARVLLALDRHPAFARQLLRSALAAEPGNGWFRLYALVAELRDGRLDAAEGQCVAPFADFLAREGAAVRWVVALEAVRGFPHVTLALRALFAETYAFDLAAPLLHGLGEEPTPGEPGDFAALHAALDRLRETATDRSAAAAAETAVLTAAEQHVSPEAVTALVARWQANWSDDPTATGAFWGRTAAAYLAPSHIPAKAQTEAEERHRWAALVDRERLSLADRLAHGARRAVRLAQRAPEMLIRG